MLVDKSHSKKDILLLFRKHGVVIDEDLTKTKIVDKISKYMKNFNYFGRIQNKTELKEYLRNPSPKQRPTTAQKTELMFKAKKIIKWAKNDYIFDGATYMDSDEPYNDIMSIYMWGDSPSIRRACKLYNQSRYCINNVNPIISPEVQDELNNDKFIRRQVLCSLKIKRGTKENPIIVRFD
jgi:hypothetical protein